ncbi:MAG: TlpA family protein disulfide reductase [Gammaproteobacteria bacterium]|nr:TlpA family protein disulfide reductase [Gammaproteobacteria bacterium]
MRPLRLALIGVAAGLAAAWAGYRAFDLVSPKPNPLVSDASEPAVDPATLQFDTLAGDRRAITDWTANYLVVNFWGTWCAPCMREVPVFIRLQERLQDRGVQFLGVAIDDREAVQKYLTTVAINYPVLLGEQQALQLNRQLGNDHGALPFTVVLDENRDVIHRQLGEWHEADAERFLLGLGSGIQR